MANIFIEETTYLSADELKESTRIKDTAFIGTDEEGDTSEDSRTILIRKAELIIDSIIGAFGTKEDVNQVTIFPTKENGLPVAIKKAAVLLCEGMFLGGELEESKAYSGAKFVKAEQYGDHKVEFQQEGVNVSGLTRKSQYVNQEIELLLKPFITVSSKVRWSKSV